MTTLSQAQPRSGASKRQLWFAAGLGLLAAFLVIVFLNGAGSGDDVPSVATIPVITAARAIPVGQKITDDMLVTKNVPESAVTADVLRDKTAAVGQVARYPIEQGETVSPGRLVAAPQVKSLSFQIPPGLRGMTIPVSITQTPAALIAPGDFVDVIVAANANLLTGRSVALPGDSNSEAKAAATLLQNIQVLTVERDYADTGVVYEPSLRGTPPDDKASVTFVTLAVTPDQAQLLWLAQENGKLTIILRAFGDDRQVQISPKSEPLTLP
jgi:pilus assembly protein CpaB